MQMESSFVRARELRRYELLDEATRNRLAASAETARGEKMIVLSLTALHTKVSAAFAAVSGRKRNAPQTSVLGADTAG
jgi:hypothetical protein